MKITILAVGKVRGPLREAVAEYEARLRHYWKLEVVEVNTGGKSPDAAPPEVRAAEAQRLASCLPAGTEIAALTRAGRGMASTELARWLGCWSHAPSGPP